MKSAILSVAIILGAPVAAFADVSLAPSMGPTVLFHEAALDENGCHTAKRKRHHFHCHPPEQPVVQEELDVTEVPDANTKVASASE